MVTRPEGWRNKRPDDPKRHSDAARGIASGSKSEVKKPRFHRTGSYDTDEKRVKVLWKTETSESADAEIWTRPSDESKAKEKFWVLFRDSVSIIEVRETHAKEGGSKFFIHGRKVRI